MRKLLITAALVAAFGPGVAAADPSIEIKDRGDFTEVIAHGVMSKKTAISPIRQRLEIPLAGVVSVKRVIPTGDPTIQLAEVDNESHVLSVKLTMLRDDVKSLARSAQAQQIGDDLHVMIPRKLPADGVTVKLPEPTLAPVAVIAPAAPVTPIAAVKVAIDAPKTDAPKPEAPKTELKLVPMPAADAGSGAGSGAGSAAAAKTEAKPIGKAEPAKPVGMPDEPGGQAMTYGALILALVVGIWWLVRKRKTAAAGGPVASTIDVIAQRSLGGKAKIVWLSAGGRDMMVAVTPQQVRMLGQWPRAAAAGAAAKPDRGRAGFAAALAARKSGLAKSAAPRGSRDGDRDREPGERGPRLAEGTDPGLRLVADDDAAPAPLSEPITPASPAIQGLMRLRQKAAPPTPPAARSKRESLVSLMVNEDIATDDVDADEEWAKEIMAATNGRIR